MMNTQDQFSQKIVKRLEESLDALPQHVLAKLEQARENALTCAPRSSKKVIFVGNGALALNWHSIGRGKMAAMAMMILLVLTLAAQYRVIQSTADEAADIDETILSDQAPVQSYLDPGFAAVLRSGLNLKPSVVE